MKFEPERDEDRVKVQSYTNDVYTLHKLDPAGVVVSVFNAVCRPRAFTPRVIPYPLINVTYERMYTYRYRYLDRSLHTWLVRVSKYT